MMKFIVISHSETDGPLVEEFQKRTDAYGFAEDLAAGGVASTILMNLMEVPAVEPEREDFGVVRGVDFPATLSPLRFA